MNRVRRSSAIVVLAIGGAVGACGEAVPAARPGSAPAEAAAPLPAPTFAADVAPFLAAHCATCHDGATKAGGLSLAAIGDETTALAARATFEKARGRLAAGTMPPKERPRPPAPEAARVIAWVDAAFARAGTASRGGIDPGHVVARRLNRLEYRNTVRDLVGVDHAPAADFPADDVAHGFDVVGEALALPPLLLEKYAAAAEAIAAKAISTEDAGRPEVRRTEAESMAVAALANVIPGAHVIAANGYLHAEASLPREGEYRVRARAWAQQAGPEPARMVLAVDGAPDRPTFEVKATAEAPVVYEATIRCPAGRHRVAVGFVNDFFDPKNPDPAQRDRNLVVDWVEVTGPTDAPPEPPAAHRRIFAADPGGDDLAVRALAVVGPLAARAWRRPPTAEDTARLGRLVLTAMARGERFERGVQIALQALLVSPRFLFRFEARPAPGEGVRSLDDHELASRLSYFLWASMPDDALFAAAEAGTLSRDLETHALRLLADPRSSALVDGFADQWLQLRRLGSPAPDAQRFPGVDERLLADMRTETEMLFETVVSEDRSVLDLLDAPFTFVSERLARHYGLPGVAGERFRRVRVSDPRRLGLLGHASVLTLTSYPTRTSPVKRGKWILDQLLDDPPPPPPPGAGTLDDGPAAGTPTTVRQRLERHRADPACAACHVRLDPLGFGLEGFDAVGRARATDAGVPVDDAGTLPDGRAFRGAEGLRALLRDDPRFPRAFARMLLTYAIGRGLAPTDDAAVDEIVATARAGEWRFSRFVAGVVRSDPFRKARGEEDPR